MVAGETWVTHHMALEFCSADFRDANTTFDICSPIEDVCEGVQGCFTIFSWLAGENLGSCVKLFGFRGFSSLSLTVFRFGRGAPMRFESSAETFDYHDLSSFCMSQTQLIEEGFVTPDNQMRFLLTLHLRADAAVMAAVQPTIEAHPHITAQWSSPPCAYSRVVLAEQLREEKVVAGETWVTHHIAYEFCSGDFRDANAIFDIYSPRQDLYEGVQGCVHVRRVTAGEDLGCYVQLCGLRGNSQITATVFQFGTGTPMESHSCRTWIKNEVIELIKLTEKGYLTADNKIRFLVTLHLGPYTSAMAAALLTIEAHPHITARWSLPPCANSIVVLAKQLHEQKVVAGETWTTCNLAHEFCSADFANANATFDICAPRQTVCEGVQGCLSVRRSAAAGNLECYVRLWGFRGDSTFTMTALRFDRGAPRQLTAAISWTKDEGRGWPCCLMQTQLVNEGWLTPDNKIRLLLTLNLRADEVLMTAVQSTIEAHPYITAQWSSPPCAYSRVVLAEQLREEKVVAGETWVTHHMAHEFCSSTLWDANLPFDINSPSQDVCVGVRGCLSVRRLAAGGNLGCHVHLFGFRGDSQFTVTVFRFGMGAPRPITVAVAWTKDIGKGWLCLLTQAQLTGEGWLTPDNKMRLLVTVHLRADAPLMAAVQPTIEAHPHITAQWSSPPCAYSRVVLAEQLREEKVVAGEIWITHHMAYEFCSASFRDVDASFEMSSPRQSVCDGVQGYLSIHRLAASGSLGLQVNLFGFRGDSQGTVTVFRFERGARRQFIIAAAWTKDEGKGWPCFMTQTQLTEEGWLTADYKIRLLLTLHLRADAAMMAAVKPNPLSRPTLTS